MSSGNSFFGVPNDELCTRLWLVGYHVLFSRQITVVVVVAVRKKATIRQVGKQVPLVVVLTESTHFMLHGVHLKTNSQVCDNAY